MADNDLDIIAEIDYDRNGGTPAFRRVRLVQHQENINLLDASPYCSSDNLWAALKTTAVSGTDQQFDDALVSCFGSSWTTGLLNRSGGRVTARYAIANR